MSKSDWEELSEEEHLHQTLKDEQWGTQRSGDPPVHLGDIPHI